MLHSIEKSRGFTLVELLVATVIIGIIATISTQLLWDTVTNRSKQDSIEISSENMRTLVNNLTNYIQEADSIDITSPGEIKIKSDICRTYLFDSIEKNIKMAEDNSLPCEPPDPATSSITQKGVEIDNFTLSPTGTNPSVITLTIIGNYNDSLGEHPINIVTTITPRVTY
jgi:prepilin-type N-terminal cleavage/methylation domain-containing protein